MSEQKTVIDTLNLFSKPVFSQLELAESIASGAALSAIQSSQALMSNLLTAAAEQYNTEMDEYDALVDSLAEKEKVIAGNSALNGLLTMARDEAIAKATAEEQQAEDGLTLVAEMQATIDSLNARIKVITQESDRLIRESAKELKRLKDLDPDRLKSQLAEKKKELAKKQQELAEMRSGFNKLRNENATLKSKNSAVVASMSELVEQVEYLKGKLDRISGTVSPQYYDSPNGRDLFYLNVFGWGLDTRALNPDCELLRGLDFHLEVRTNSGICILVSIDQFGAPVFPTVPGFEKAWPAGLTEDIQAKIMDLLQPTHPMIVDRYEWATGVDIADLPIETKHQDALVAAGMHNLFDVMHRTPEELEARVIGFGMATARKVRAKCLGVVKEWENAYKREEKAA